MEPIKQLYNDMLDIQVRILNVYNTYNKDLIGDANLAALKLSYSLLSGIACEIEEDIVPSCGLPHKDLEEYL